MTRAVLTGMAVFGAIHVAAHVVIWASLGFRVVAQ